MEGKYYTNEGQLVGKVEDFQPEEWFGKVTLFGLEDCAEYGTLEPETWVALLDGIKYHGEWDGNKIVGVIKRNGELETKLRQLMTGQ